MEMMMLMWPRDNDDVMYDPEKVVKGDYILCESTYGDRVHKDIDAKEELANIINKTVSRGGNIIIPAFAVGRTQLLLYYIYKLKKELKSSFTLSHNMGSIFKN